jgi:hypothetical protein
MFCIALSVRFRTIKFIFFICLMIRTTVSFVNRQSLNPLMRGQKGLGEDAEFVHWG